MSQYKHFKVLALPAELEPDSIYFVKSASGFNTFITDNAGTPIPMSFAGANREIKEIPNTAQYTFATEDFTDKFLVFTGGAEINAILPKDIATTEGEVQGITIGATILNFIAKPDDPAPLATVTPTEGKFPKTMGDRSKFEIKMTSQNDYAVYGDLEEIEKISEGKIPLQLKVVVTEGQTIELPTGIPSGNYLNDFIVDWGDGSETEREDGAANASHTYTTAGTYIVEITGIVQFLHYSYLPNTIEDRGYLTEVVSWGNIKYQVLAFSACRNLSELPINETPHLENAISARVFLNKTNISVLPTGLLKRAYNIVNFSSAFRDMKITAIPDGFFSECRMASEFESCFWGSPITEVGLPFHGAIKAKNFKWIFRECSITSINPDIFITNIVAENFEGSFYDCDIQTFPNGIHNNNPLADNFFEEFRYNPNMTGTADPLWLMFPDAERSGNCFQQSTLLTNFAQIPTNWGGTFEGTYPQLPIKHQNYWNPDLDKPQWFINGVWKDAGQGSGGSAPAAQSLTGTALDLSNIVGNNYNYATPSASTSYTFTNPVINGFARCFINAATEPTVTGATKLMGSVFEPNTDMEMVVESPDGTNVEYYFILR